MWYFFYKWKNLFLIHICIGNSRKNHLLCHEVIRWRSDVPLTEGQLRSKRDEFWDTAPAFDGRKEIWDALRAGATAAEAQDYQLAQAILDGANISVPSGFLTECYDELGTRYQVPIYCLSYPINIVKEDSGRDSPADCSGKKKHFWGLSVYGRVYFFFSLYYKVKFILLLYQLYIEPVDGGIEQTLRLRLSTTLGEVKLPVYSKDTIGNAKKKLQVR